MFDIIKKIKIFIGSSIDELANERNELARFIQGLNNKYVERGIFLEGYFYEETSYVMPAENSHDYIKYNADAAIFMFFNKASKFTLEKLDLARKTFLEDDRPSVFVFFKAVDSTTSATDEIKKCVSKVADDYGHYFKMFDSVDTIKLELLQYLVDSMPGAELKIQDGKVYLGEETIENINADNVFAYQNNSDIKRLKKQIEILKVKMIDAARKGAETERLQIVVELKKVQDTYHHLENSILDLLKKIFYENKKKSSADPRYLEALHFLELGDIEKAKTIIFSIDEINMRTKSHRLRHSLSEMNYVEEANRIINDTLLRIQILELDISNSNRFQEIESSYDSILNEIYETKRYELIYDYAVFLGEQNNYPKGISLAEKLNYINANPDNTVSNYSVAQLNLLLGRLYYGNKELKKSKCAYNKALKIFKKISNDTKGYMVWVAYVSKALADLFCELEQLDKSEKMYYDALHIVESLEKTEYIISFIADINNSLANLFVKTERFEAAEKLFKFALQSYEKLAQNADDRTWDCEIARISANYADLCRETKNFKKAEDLFLTSIDIFYNLSYSVNTAMYEPSYANVCNSFASYYDEIDKDREAEILYSKALEIYERLSNNIGASAFEPNVAYVCYNLAWHKIKIEAMFKINKLIENVDNYSEETINEYVLRLSRIDNELLIEDLLSKALTIANKHKSHDQDCREIYNKIKEMPIYEKL